MNSVYILFAKKIKNKTEKMNWIYKRHVTFVFSEAFAADELNSNWNRKQLSDFVAFNAFVGVASFNFLIFVTFFWKFSTFIPVAQSLHFSTLHNWTAKDRKNMVLFQFRDCDKNQWIKILYTVLQMLHKHENKTFLFCRSRLQSFYFLLTCACGDVLLNLQTNKNNKK